MAKPAKVAIKVDGCLVKQAEIIPAESRIREASRALVDDIRNDTGKRGYIDDDIINAEIAAARNAME